MTENKRCVLFFSTAGKPIYSYGFEDQDELSVITSSLTALLYKASYVLSSNEITNSNLTESDKLTEMDSLKWICSESHRIVFLERQGIYLVCISSYPQDPIGYMRGILDYTYYQFIVLITGSIHNTLKARPNFDVSQMLSFTDIGILDNCISAIQENFDAMYWTYPLQRFGRNLSKKKSAAKYFNNTDKYPFDPPAIYIETQPLDISYRNKVHDLLRFSHKNLLGGALFIYNRIITWFGSKYIPVFPSTDFVLLNNIIASFTKSKSSTSDELWIPICLPCISSLSYIYCYIHYWKQDNTSNMDRNICFVILSSDSDISIFELFSAHSNDCKNKILKSDALLHPTSAIISSRISLSLLYSDPDLFNIEIYHFMYAVVSQSCYISSEIHPDIYDTKKSVYIYQKYFKCAELANSQLSQKRTSSCTIIIRTISENFLLLITSEFHLFATFSGRSLINQQIINATIRNLKRLERSILLR
ncbi:hypothetical protein ACR3K2_14830 [Cryptosporidium serpentis]